MRTIVLFRTVAGWAVLPSAWSHHLGPSKKTGGLFFAVVRITPQQGVRPSAAAVLPLWPVDKIERSVATPIQDLPFTIPRGVRRVPECGVSEVSLSLAWWCSFRPAPKRVPASEASGG